MFKLKLLTVSRPRLTVNRLFTKNYLCQRQRDLPVRLRVASDSKQINWSLSRERIQGYSQSSIIISTRAFSTKKPSDKTAARLVSPTYHYFIDEFYQFLIKLSIKL